MAAADNVCSVISVSFEICGADATFFSAFDAAVKAADGNGQSVFVQTDDFGAANPVSILGTQKCQASTTSKGINEMAGSKTVTAVGGTQFTPNYDPTTIVQKSFVAESAWNEASIGATGGGLSAVYSHPTYQTGPGVPNDSFRDVPDVSMATGTSLPGFFIGNDNSGQGVIDCFFGGTSLSTPTWAAIAKLAEQRKGAFLGSINPQIYLLGGLGLSGGFHDVVKGNNDFPGVTGFSATLAYDQATGWGSADVTTFVNALVFSRGLVATGIKGSNTTITSAEIYTPTSRSAGGFSPGGTFVDNRINFGVSALPDGTVLVFGGVKGGSPVKTAGIYSPALGSFTLLNASMPNKRETDIHATLLLTGQVFISGRDDSSQDISTALYDPVGKNFNTLSPNQIAPPKGVAAAGYTQTLLANGQVLIEGGSAVSQVYDPILNNFTATNGKPKIANRSFASSVLLPDGRVLIAGGTGSPMTAEVYTPSTATPPNDFYTQVGNMTEARTAPPLILLKTGKALVMGTDATADLFDPAANTFSPTGMMQVARIAFGFSRLNNGTVLIAGGLDSHLNALSSAEIYDPVAGAFNATGSLTTARNSPFDFAVK